MRLVQMLSLNAIKYTMQHLLNVAFPNSGKTSFEVSLQDGFVSIFLQDITLNIPIFNENEFDDFLKGNSSFTLIDEIPFFNHKNQFLEANYTENCLYIIDDSVITIPFDLISPSFALLSQMEEFNCKDFDEHGRFKFISSICCKYNIIDIPLVDEYAMFLRRLVLKFRPRMLDFVPKKATFVPTHDIDILQRFKNNLQALRSIFGRDLLINRSLSDVKLSLTEFKNWKKDPFNDPYILSIIEFLKNGKDNSQQPIFFFKSQIEDEHDATYSISDTFVKNIIKQVADEGAIVGLHGSYESATNCEILTTEKQRIENILKTEVLCSRQHYLRTFFTKEHNSVSLWGSTGIKNDYSLGFAERPGFRCGTCHPYLLYNLMKDCASDILEHPLILMDGSLFDYMKLTETEAFNLAAKLLERTCKVEGDFVVLWHNHTTSRNYKNYYNEVYIKLLSLFFNRNQSL